MNILDTPYWPYMKYLEKQAYGVELEQPGYYEKLLCSLIAVVEDLNRYNFTSLYSYNTRYNPQKPQALQRAFTRANDTAGVI